MAQSSKDSTATSVPMATTFRIVCAIIALCAMLGLVFQERMVLQLKGLEVVARSAQVITFAGGSSSRTSSSLAATPLAVKQQPKIHFDNTRPLFVLSLPNHYDLAIPRYFQCAGYSHLKEENSTLGYRWLPKPTKPRVPRKTLGHCLRDKVTKRKGNKKNNETSSCGNHYHVWTNLQYLNAPNPNPKRQRYSDCFDIVLFPGGLERLATLYPQGATILNVIRDPMEWVKTLSPQIPQFWHEWCNEDHNNNFPGIGEYDNQRSLLGFYLQYQDRIKSFAKKNPTWNYVEVDLRHVPEQIGEQLQQQLGIAQQCWMDSTQGNITGETVVDDDDTSVLPNQPRVNDITFPALVTAMPKSGTSTLANYFNCGMGPWFAAHQWTWMDHESYRPFAQTTIGECLLTNIENNTYPLFKGCGNSMVWSDAGVLRHHNKHTMEPGLCYLPQIHKNTLQRFYDSYPHGTIIHIVRNTTSWLGSVKRWNNLHSRWVKGKCKGGGFPKYLDASDRDWWKFYDGVTQAVRDFTKDHPSLTYIELPLTSQAEPIMYDIFRFPSACWGHHNANDKGQRTYNRTRVRVNATTASNDTRTAAASINATIANRPRKRAGIGWRPKNVTAAVERGDNEQSLGRQERIKAWKQRRDQKVGANLTQQT